MVEGVAEQAKKIRVGPGLEAETQMGPLVSREQLDRVCGYLESGFSEGAKALAGGKQKGDKGYFVEPTVLVNTSNNMKVIQEEIFGPVVAAIPFKDAGDVAVRANDSIYGLAGGVFPPKRGLGPDCNDGSIVHRNCPACVVIQAFVHRQHMSVHQQGIDLLHSSSLGGNSALQWFRAGAFAEMFSEGR